MLGGLDWGKRMYTCNRRRAIKLIPVKVLEQENTRLRRAVADLTLDKQILQEVTRGNG